MRFGFAPMPADFLAQWAANRACFPLGLDLILAAGDKIACLPRKHAHSWRGPLMYVAVKGGERAIDNAHRCLPTGGAAGSRCRN